MPLFMDVHTMGGPLAAADVAGAHQADLKTQARYGVDYKQYWVDEEHGKVFCLVEAPDADAAIGPPRGTRTRRRRDLPGLRRPLTRK